MSHLLQLGLIDGRVDGFGYCLVTRDIELNPSRKPFGFLVLNSHEKMKAHLNPYLSLLNGFSNFSAAYDEPLCFLLTALRIHTDALFREHDSHLIPLLNSSKPFMKTTCLSLHSTMLSKS